MLCLLLAPVFFEYYCSLQNTGQIWYFNSWKHSGCRKLGFKMVSKMAFMLALESWCLTISDLRSSILNTSVVCCCTLNKTRYCDVYHNIRNNAYLLKIEQDKDVKWVLLNDSVSLIFTKIGRINRWCDYTGNFMPALNLTGSHTG